MAQHPWSNYLDSHMLSGCVWVWSTLSTTGPGDCSIPSQALPCHLWPFGISTCNNHCSSRFVFRLVSGSNQGACMVCLPCLASLPCISDHESSIGHILTKEEKSNVNILVQAPATLNVIVNNKHRRTSIVCYSLILLFSDFLYFTISCYSTVKCGIAQTKMVWICGLNLTVKYIR